MKRVLINIGFAILCVIAFLAAVSIAYQLTTAFILGNAYAAWETDWSDEVGTIYRDIDLNEAEQTGYDLYIPTNADKSQAQSLIVYMHGGGFTSGDSAGGYLALLYAYRAGEASPIPVKLVFQMTGPATFEPGAWDITETEDIIESISRLSGKTVTEDMIASGEINAIIREISPALLVGENTVPTVMAYGSKDKIVRVNLKYELMDALDENEIDYTYIEFPNSGHGMLFDPDKTQEYVNTVNQYLEEYMENH